MINQPGAGIKNEKKKATDRLSTRITYYAAHNEQQQFRIKISIETKKNG
jgi:hypothetical protein